MGIASEYRALSRERFLWKEMRVVAKLLVQGYSANDIKHKAMDENIFEYPTLSMVRDRTNVCLKRLEGMESQVLLESVVNLAPDTAKLICLYATMKQNKTICDFMVSVIGEKFRTMDMSFSRGDITMFMHRLQEQDAAVATWSAKTVARSESTLGNILIETEYLDSYTTGHINTVWIPSFLKDAIIDNGDSHLLPAFNCFI